MDKKKFIKLVGVSASVLFTGVGIYKLNSTQRNKRKSSATNRTNHLSPFEDEITVKHIAYLLERTTFGVNQRDIAKYTQLGMDATIEKLFEELSMPPPPINFEFEKDIYTPIGDSWVEAPYMAREVFLEQYRKKSLQAWIMGVIYKEEVSIREQMVLFWHNHFGVSDIVEHKFEYIHNDLLRKNAFGNFKELTKAITIDPAMLHFLSGFENTKDSPNENYARELLELYTVGKGALIAPGDYTTFTEKDVRAIARILTGWTYVGWYSNYKHEPIKAIFQPEKHDNEKIKLSAAFKKVVIPQLMENRYIFLIDEIFKKKEVALNICRKLYRWFVHYDINQSIEKEIIQPLANQLIHEQFEIKPVLQTLLKSNHFFERMDDAPKIMNPVEYVFSTIKKLPHVIPDDPIEQYFLWHNWFDAVASLGLEYFKPPSVAGWKAYYQEPMYYKLWINAATLKNKKSFIDQIVIKGYENVKFNIDFQELISYFYRSENSLSEVNSFYQGLLNSHLNAEHEQKIQTLMFQNLDVKRWKEVLELASKSNHPENQIVVENIKQSLTYIFSLPEYNFF